jgi:uncharacterized protein
MRERISTAMKDALKSGDKRRLSTLRLVTAAIKDRDIAARVDDKGHATGRDKIGDTEVLALLQKMIKQRRESLAIYEKAGRKEQAEQEATEIAVIEEFLPRQMSDAEAREAVAVAIKETGAASPKDMGRVMGALKQRYAGQMDFGKASGLVKELLK